jgi:uridylate kinase
MRYKRVLIKLSGAAVAGEREVGFEQKAIEHIVDEVLSVKAMGIQVAIVIGGGNIFRGNVAQNWGIERAEADNIGVLGTVINSLMLRGALKAKGDHEVRVMTAVPMSAIAEPFIRLRAVHHLEKGYIVILAGGIGQPFVTTDYPAIQRAVEIRCDAILVAKHGVNGVFTADPKKDSKAKPYKTLAYDDFIHQRINIMDQSALILAREYSLPIHIFNFDKKGAMARICEGQSEGTFIGPGTKMEVA